MNPSLLNKIIKGVYESIPDLWKFVAVKTQEMLERQLRSRALALFRGKIDGNGFLDGFSDVLGLQLLKAWNEGADESGVLPEDMTDEDMEILATLIDEEIEFIYQLGDDIIELSQETTPLTEKEALDAFRSQIGSRLDMWANRYNEVANRAKIHFGGKEKYKWVLGETEKHCTTCSALNGIVAFAWEWDESGVVPGQADSEYLECGGWRCDCHLDSVGSSEPRTRGALGRIRDITG